MQLSSYKRLQYPAFTVYKYLHANGKLEEPYRNFMAEVRPEFEFYDLKKDPMETLNLCGSKKCRKKENELKTQLQLLLNDIEKNMVTEDAETILKAKESSAKWFENAMKKQGYSGEISDEQMMEYWNKKLLSVKKKN